MPNKVFVPNFARPYHHQRIATTASCHPPLQWEATRRKARKDLEKINPRGFRGLAKGRWTSPLQRQRSHKSQLAQLPRTMDPPPMIQRMSLDSRSNRERRSVKQNPTACRRMVLPVANGRKTRRKPSVATMAALPTRNQIFFRQTCLIVSLYPKRRSLHCEN